jgi:outer membrane protein TolC
VVSTYRKLQELKSQGELNTRIALENLIADITAEYYNYIQQKIRLKNLRYAVALSKERLRIVEQRYRIGNFSGLDYQQARVDFNSDSSKFMKQQETLKSSAIVLNELLAREDLDKTITVADTAITVDKFIELNDIMDSMMDNNASLLLAKSQSSVSELEYKITSSQSYPYLRMNAGYGYTKNTYNNQVFFCNILTKKRPSSRKSLYIF